MRCYMHTVLSERHTTASAHGEWAQCATSKPAVHADYVSSANQAVGEVQHMLMMFERSLLLATDRSVSLQLMLGASSPNLDEECPG